MSSAVILIIVGVIFFLILILIAVRLGISDPDKENKPEDIQPVIHTSGIYSIVRKSPRDNIHEEKPTNEEVEQYLTSQDVDLKGNSLSNEDKKSLLLSWKQSLKKSIETVEEGDKSGVEFYYFKSTKKNIYSPIPKGAYVTREEIFNFPQILPPLHLGCKQELYVHEGNADLNDTAIIGMQPLINKGILPELPDWKEIHI